jgi:hypothetical protein
MDILFENRYTRTKEIMREYCGYMFFLRPSMVICDCLLVFFVVASILLGGSPGIALVLVLTAAAQLILYFYTPNAMEKRDAEAASGGTITVEAAATDDLLLFRVSNGAEQELPYVKMKKVAQTKRLILIYTEAKLCYILPKDTFTKGTAEAFLAFLKEKGIGK